MSHRHDAQVTKITFMTREFEARGGSIYLAECTCGWSGGRYWDTDQPAQDQVEKHMEKRQDWERA